jgi:hypothetical protein
MSGVFPVVNTYNETDGRPGAQRVHHLIRRQDRRFDQKEL